MIFQFPAGYTNLSGNSIIMYKNELPIQFRIIKYSRIFDNKCELPIH